MDSTAIKEQMDIDDEMDDYDDDDDDDDDDGYVNDPLSLVSVGLTEEHDDDDEEEISTTGSPSSSSIDETRCSVCKLSFGSKVDLRRHVKLLHDNICVHTCNFCGGVFSDVKTYTAHLIRVHRIDKSKLPDESSSEEKLQRLTLREDVQSCPECGMKFANKTTLNIHRLRRHIAKNLGASRAPCPVCHEDADDLTAHCRRAHGIDGVVCPLCAKILSKTCTLNRHIEQVHLNLQIHKPATCSQCQKVFSKKGHLDRHVRTIHMGLKESSEPCPFCGKVFSTKSSLEPHIEMVHKGVRKECPSCGKVLSDLWKHMRTVHGLYRRRAKIPKESLVFPSATATAGPQLQQPQPQLQQSPIVTTQVKPIPDIPKSVPLHVQKIIRNNVLNGSVTIVKSDRSSTGSSTSISLQTAADPTSTSTSSSPVKIVKIRGKKSYTKSPNVLKKKD